MGPVAALVTGLVTAGAAFGLWLGLRALPPGETEMIEAAAARYVAETGGARTDCAGRPAAMAGVRMVVTCGPDWAVALDRWGRRVDGPRVGPGT
ncbi:hypothetical protein HKCCSP123_19860 [Rhodobacterales bacterium HKCCSP123]|nr:hypothetical protein [Rhodobacterales bacterium HKCCSP123]